MSTIYRCDCQLATRPRKRGRKTKEEAKMPIVEVRFEDDMPICKLCDHVAVEESTSNWDHLFINPPKRESNDK